MFVDLRVVPDRNLGACSYNKPFTSPDGRFVARWFLLPSLPLTPHRYFDDPNNPLDCFAITDNQTKTNAILDQSLAVLSVRWMGDSKTLVVAEVIAHGSKCELYNFDTDHWTCTGCPPPHEGPALYRLTKQSVSATKLVLTYAVWPESPAKPYKIAFAAEAATGSVIRVLAKKPISVRYWERLAEE